MPEATPRRTALVCIVAQNCLAEAYLRQLLDKHPFIRALGLKQYTELPPSRTRNTVFVVDACGLGISLNECLRRLRTRCSNAKFLIIDQEKSAEQIVRFLVMGAQGYLLDADVPGMLVRAVLSVAANKFWTPPEVFHEFLREAASVLRKDSQAPHTTTPREDQILELIRRRLSNREIAHLLSIRVSTVKFHVSNILSKMQVRNRSELIETPTNQLWGMLFT